mmetsp:Transcript_17366/g.47320  ORF Transcript_17366/g.47320 Transcript_17366/m.47320 type:complete len:215 (-) Transcript_17366:106-750(-)|eukprot:CAMPEP_0117526540 /NCGR_PEP_ID=MMETSP0784-20121206/36337_1 /TAXON_ID=39447 /ORGANISM="" /LENGTH=214 /DNA_ID=CAMNT_0005322769 /DNA_START=105 /DNA_END=749 /DNA_ORIENTATION=-
MAINPTLAKDDVSGDLFPLPSAGEAFILKRDGIDFSCALPRGGKLTGRGVFYLSSKRIVFVSSKSNRPDFTSFEVFLETLKAPKFNQPIFGANYLSGDAAPLPGDLTSPLAGHSAHFTLTFNSGGCGTFLNLFFQLLSDIQERTDASHLAQAAQDGRLNQVAFVDPNDPSVLYLSQPAAAPNSQQTTAFEVDAPSAPPAPGGQGQRQGQDCIVS